MSGKEVRLLAAKVCSGFTLTVCRKQLASAAPPCHRPVHTGPEMPYYAETTQWAKNNNIWSTSAIGSTNEEE